MEISVTLITETVRFDIDINTFKKNIEERKHEIADVLKNKENINSVIHELLNQYFLGDKKGRAIYAFADMYFLLKPIAFLDNTVSIDVMEIIDLLPNNDGNDLIATLVADKDIPLKKITLRAGGNDFCQYYKGVDFNRNDMPQKLKNFIKVHLGAEDIRQVDGEKVAELIIELATSGQLNGERMENLHGIEALYHTSFPEETVDGEIVLDLGKLHNFWLGRELQSRHVH